MTWIETVSPDNASGAVKKMYETYQRQFGFVPNIRRSMSLNPTALRALERSHLPVVVDPSHGTGRSSLVPPMCLASVAAGADALIVEVHPEPQKAMSDGDQSLDFPQFESLMKQIGRVAEAVDRAV